MAALILASSCVQDEGGLNPPEPQTVTIKADAGSTKTALDDKGKVKWEAEDAIDLMFTHSKNGPAIHLFTTDTEGESADFTGKLPLEVTRENSGYEDQTYAVYPSGALTDDGTLAFALPSQQKVRDDGTFAKGLNLASASVSLDDIRDDGNASATFRNALSIIRFSVKSDMKSVTLTGTSPLAGTAPLAFVTDGEYAGRLVVCADGNWTDASNSVTVLPAEGKECFAEGEVVNLLVWPGTHTGMSVTVDFKEFGEYMKSKTFDFEFEPAKYYTLNLNADSEVIVTELVGKLEAIEGELDGLDGLEERLAALETDAQKVNLLLDQIQSVSLVTEYLDNAVYAYYGKASFGYVKEPLTLDYIVRPAKAMGLLLDICSDRGTLSEVLSAKIDYRTGSLNSLTVREAVLEDDILTVIVDAVPVEKGFYDGNTPASVALEISDDNTEILSDFANLVPKQGLALDVYKTTDIPAMRGTTLSFQFDYSSLNFANVTGTIRNVSGFKDNPTLNLNTYKGTVRATFSDTDNISKMGFTVELKDNATGETKSVDFTFEDVGDFIISYTSAVPYVGGIVTVTATPPQNKYKYSNPKMELSGNAILIQYDPYTYQEGTEGSPGNTVTKYREYWYKWAFETSEGVGGTYTVLPNEHTTVELEDNDTDDPDDTQTVLVNTGETMRVFYVNVNVQTTDLKYSYNKTVQVTQSEYGAPIDESLYYHDHDVVTLQEATATCAHHLNLVIVGDGYQKGDLFKGGSFERHARSAYGAFFGTAPYSHFKDRFNVYMMPFESVNAGPRLGETENGHSTYFGTHYKSSDNTWVSYSGTGEQRVIEEVKNTLKLTGADFYRTIVIMLVNTDLSLGSTDYPFQTTVSGADDPGDGYASFSISVLAANVTNVNSLVRHEAAGHGFGRLGDEYVVSWYTPELVENQRHNVGFYRNVATTTSYWKAFTDAGYGSDKVMYDPYGNDLYRSTHESGIMWNNNGNFNAVSRHAIYERIIKQTEGYDAYSWEKFLEYDKRNL